MILAFVELFDVSWRARSCIYTAIKKKNFFVNLNAYGSLFVVFVYHDTAHQLPPVRLSSTTVNRKHHPKSDQKQPAATNLIPNPQVLLIITKAQNFTESSHVHFSSNNFVETEFHRGVTLKKHPEQRDQIKKNLKSTKMNHALSIIKFKKLKIKMINQ